MTDNPEISARDREHHDRVASRYDEWFVEPLQYRLLNAEVLREVARTFAPEGGLLVEFGAGTGATAIRLHQRGYQVLAVDNSEGMLERLARKCPEMQTLAADVGAALPIESDSAGCVLMSQTLHHVPDHRRVIQEVHRILRRGGKVCVFEPQFLPRGLDFLRRVAQRHCCPGDHADWESPVHPGELKRLLRSGGFRPLRWGTMFFLPFNPRSRLGRWLVRRLWTVPRRIPLIRRLGGVFMICAEKT